MYQPVVRHKILKDVQVNDKQLEAPQVQVVAVGIKLFELTINK